MSGVKISARVLLVLGSCYIAYLVTRYVASFTGVPLGAGTMEATPTTLVAIFTSFPLTLRPSLVTAQALSDLIRNVAAATENIGGIMCGIGSLLFFFLFLKSGYIPRILAGLGVFAFAIWVALYFATLIFPERRDLFQTICFVPVGVTDIITGFWLILVPLRTAALATATNRE